MSEPSPADGSRPRLALFDFDGTLTTGDSFLRFILFGIRRTGKYVTGLFRVVPCLLLLYYRRLTIAACKEKVLTYLFKSMPREQLQQLGEEFATSVLPGLLNPASMARMDEHLRNGDTVLVATASYDVYMEPWCRRHGVRLVASDVQVKDGIVTGRLDGLHCNKAEKARRIREAVCLEDYGHISAYGDTSGDLPMLALAHAKYYRHF